MSESRNGAVNTSESKITGDVVGGDKVGRDKVGRDKITTIIQYPPAPEEKRHTLSPKARRNREKVLWNVKHQWIRGVLEPSLHQTAFIDLVMTVNQAATRNPWNTVIEHPRVSGQILLTDTKIIAVFKEDFGGKLLILGEPGSGKTTTLLKLAQSLITLAENDTEQLIPIVLNLSTWANKRKSLAAWLVDELQDKYGVSLKVAKDWVEKEQILPLLDGLNDVKQEHRNACVEVINQFSHRYSSVDIVVCSRVEKYETLTQHLELQAAVIQPLTTTQLETYLIGLGAKAEEVRQAILRDTQLQELVKTPLFLNLAIVTYGGSETRNIIAHEQVNREQLRRQLFDAYVTHVFEGQTVANMLYTPAQTKHWLAWLARKMQTQALTTFYIESLQPGWLETERERRTYKLGVGLVTGLLIAPPWGVFDVLTGGNGLFFLLFFGLLGVAIGYKADIIRVAEVLNFNVRGFFSGLLVGLFLGPLAMLVRGLGLLGGQNNALIGEDALVFGLFFGLFFGLSAGLTRGLRTTERENVETRISPNQGIWNSLRNWLLVGLAFGLLGGLLGGLLITMLGGFIINGLLGGLSFGLLGGLSFGLLGIPSGTTTTAVARHIVLRFSLFHADYSPRNYARFLDYAASLFLLRKVGGGYIFLHGLLQEYFAFVEQTSGLR